MPHSSGGGSSGGGFHSGSSSSSSSGANRPYSRTPFGGSHTYVYYGMFHRPRLFYSASSPSSFEKPRLFPILIVYIFLAIPLVFLLLSANHNPTKIETNYDTTIPIYDRKEIISEEEKETLKSTFADFFEVSGITPSLLTVDNNSWQGQYSELTDYAYDQYLKAFKDESHWLIVYAADTDTAKRNWYFEGMQGNDTDGVLHERTTDTFNKKMVELLRNDSYTVATAVNESFREILPGLMNHAFYLSSGSIMGVCVIGVIFVIFTGSTVINYINVNKMRSGSVEIAGTPILKKCPNCGTEYYEGTMSRCVKCGVSLTGIKVASFKNKDKEDPISYVSPTESLDDK